MLEAIGQDFIEQRFDGLDLHLASHRQKTSQDPLTFLVAGRSLPYFEPQHVHEFQHQESGYDKLGEAKFKVIQQPVSFRTMLFQEEHLKQDVRVDYYFASKPGHGV